MVDTKACAPDNPIARAAMRQDVKLLSNYSACGGSMARVVSVHRLLEALRPELESRLRAAHYNFTGSLSLKTDIGDATLGINKSQISVHESNSLDKATLSVSLPQFELARLALGAFPPQDILSRQSYPPSKEVSELLTILFPARHPHMHLPDRY